MPPRHAKAIAHLTAVDPILGRWIAQAGPCSLTRERAGTHFAAVARSIVYQQLSGKAAGTIHARFEALFGGRSPEPHQVLKVKHATLRGIGLSERKAEYVRGLAEDVHRGRIPLERVDEMPDAEVIETLTQVRGVGEWTAQMFLMFRLGRPDVLPTLDLGIQKGMQRAYGLRRLPSPERMEKLAAAWRPHRTGGGWYLWRYVDG